MHEAPPGMTLAALLVYRFTGPVAVLSA